MSSAERSGGEMRQMRLADALGNVQPWRDHAPITHVLRVWADNNGFRDVDVRAVALALVEPPELDAELKRRPEREHPALRRAWYSSLDTLTPDELAAAAVLMLRNVRKGRRPKDYGLNVVRGVSSDVERGYVRRHGQVGALHAWLDTFQYGQKLHQLMLHDRTEPAARRWIQRYPGVWPACQPMRAGVGPWQLIRRGCATREDFLQRHFSGDWPAPQP